MGWKEDLEEKRQRKQAQRFFRQNNREFFDGAMWAKLAVTGILMAVVFGVIYAVFVALTHIRFMYVLALLGVMTSRVLKKVAHTGNQKVAALSLASYILGVLFSEAFLYAFTFWLTIGVGTPLTYLFTSLVWRAALAELVSNNLLGALCLCIGGYYAYQSALYD